MVSFDAESNRFYRARVSGANAITTETRIWVRPSEAGTAGVYVTGVQLADTQSAYQRVGEAYDVTESGVPSIPAARFDGNDYWTTGVQSFGTASLFCDAGQTWAVGGAVSTFGSNSICAKSSAPGSGTAQFNFGLDLSGFARTFLRGTLTITASLIWDGLWHVWDITWDGTTCTLTVDGVATVLAVGAAAEEAENILWSARTESAVSGFFTGFNYPLLMIDRCPSASEMQSWRSSNKAYFGSP